MEGSRIWIDLSAVCTRAHKQSCIYLDYEKSQNVKDVEDHIRRVFGIDNPVNIFNEGWLLPSSESSRLLRDNDTVSVKDAESISSPGSDQNNESVKSTLPSAALNQGDKAGPGSITNKIATITNAKESAVSNIIVTIPNKPERPHSAPNTLVDPIRKVSVKVPAEKTDTPQNDDMSSPATNQDNDSNTNVSGNESIQDGEPKRKRRRRKRKNKSTMDADDSSKPKEIRHSPYVMNKILQGVSHILNTSVADVNKKHIFFREEPVQDLHKSNEEVSVKGSHNPSSTSSCDNVDGGLSKLMSYANQRSPVVFERKKLQSNKSNGSPLAEQGKTHSNVKLSPLTEIPVKNTVIMFKILRMVNYSPTVSQNITAHVISADHDTGRLYVRITEGLDEMRPEKGKFCLDNEAEEDEIPTEYTFLDWKSLLEPKAVEYC